MFRLLICASLRCAALATDSEEDCIGDNECLFSLEEQAMLQSPVVRAKIAPFEEEERQLQQQQAAATAVATAAAAEASAAAAAVVAAAQAKAAAEAFESAKEEAAAAAAASATAAASAAAAAQPSAAQQDGEARNRCRHVMRTAPDVIGQAMFDEVNVCEDFGVTNLYQADFKDGTYIIRNPGIYRIQENIAMHPETPHMMPPKDSETYVMADGYWLGFVAAIAVASDNVYLDLNDKTVEMSHEFLMRQRFFMVVNLGERPFEAGAGPPQFGAIEHSPFWASNVVISDGQIGVSSHTGVHGWHNSKIWINHVHVRDFETAGIQINGATDVHITDTEVGPTLGHSTSAHVVPGLATLSQAQMLLRIIDGEEIQDDDVAFTNLRASVERYIAQTLSGGVVAESERLFVNEAGVPDGSSIHGIVLHPPHPAIHDFAACVGFDGEEHGNSLGPVTLKDVTIRDLTLQADEVVSMRDSQPKPIMGPAGDVLQIFRIRDAEGNYAGNVLSEAQLALGRLKLAHAGGDEDEVFRLFGATNIPLEFIAWSRGEMPWETMVSSLGGQFVCMKDAMTHHNKGTMGIRIEYYHDVSLSGVHLRNFENVGVASEVSHCSGDDLTYSGNDARGITFSHVSGIQIDDVSIQGMSSVNGHAYGVEERIAVAYEGTHEYHLQDIHGGSGSTDIDTGVNGMLSSDDR